jgi:hypothetical protein
LVVRVDDSIHEIIIERQRSPKVFYLLVNDGLIDARPVTIIGAGFNRYFQILKYIRSEFSLDGDSIIRV